MKSASQYRRILALHTIVKKYGQFCKQDLQEKTFPEVRALGEVSWRTIQRDIEKLRYDFNAPLEFDAGRQHYIYTDPSYELPAAILSDRQVIHLVLGKILLEQFQGTEWHATIEWLFEKMKQTNFGLTAFLELEEVFSYFENSNARIASPELFALLIEAVRSKLKVQCVYNSFSSGSQTQRILHPYHIFGYQNQWYIAAWCEKRQEVRDFNTNRMREVQILKDNFEVDNSFDLQRYLHQRSFGIEKGDSVHEVSLRFSQDQGRYIQERIWHESQEVSQDEAGRYILTMKVSLTDELMRWVMSYGARVEVLTPKSLKTEIKQRHLSAAHHCSKDRGE